MGQSTEELTAQIAATRGSLSSDLDELQDKVSPAAIVERKKEAARSRVSGVRSKVMGQARSANESTPSATDVAGAAQQRFDGAPLAAGLAAFGLGMVVASLIPVSDRETTAAARLVEVAKEQGQPLVEDAKSAAADVGAQLKQTASEAAGQVKESATDAATAVRDEGKDSVDTIKSQTQD